MSDEYVTHEEFEEFGERVSTLGGEIKSLIAADTTGRFRAPSKSHLIGAGHSFSGSDSEAGAFISAVATAGDPQAYPEARTQAKATLEGLTAGYEKGWGEGARISRTADGEQAWAKAMLATTDATGGWLVPNALVDDIIKPAQYRNPYRALMTVVPGVTTAAVDIPMRTTAPSAMLIVARGASKDNIDVDYNGYTATMYTLARIHDIGNQFLRESAGAAERDVLQELATAAALGERYYIIDGTGSGQPYGLQTALTNSAYSNEAGSYTAAATLAGSISSAISFAAGNLADRNVEPTAAVVGASTYWKMLREGSDAGFYFNGDVNRSTVPGLPPNTLISRFGIPVIPDNLLSQTDDLIVGDFRSLKLYLGAAFRVDSSSIAGTRWDQNLTGFRGEEEMAFDARAAVLSGHFTRIQDVVA